jgi:hypothetical protein
MRINPRGGGRRGVPRDSLIGWEIKNNIHVHCSVAAGSRMYTIQVHPSWKLQVDWIPSGLTERGRVPWVEGDRSPLHIISHGPGRIELHSTPASFVWHIDHDCTLDRSVRTGYTRIFSCRTQYQPIESEELHSAIFKRGWQIPKVFKKLF